MPGGSRLRLGYRVTSVLSLLARKLDEAISGVFFLTSQPSVSAGTKHGLSMYSEPSFPTASSSSHSSCQIIQGAGLANASAEPQGIPSPECLIPSYLYLTEVARRVERSKGPAALPTRQKQRQPPRRPTEAAAQPDTNTASRNPSDWQSLGGQFNQLNPRLPPSPKSGLTSRCLVVRD